MTNDSISAKFGIGIDINLFLWIFSELVKPLIYLSSLHLFYLVHPDLNFLNIGILTLFLILWNAMNPNVVLEIQDFANIASYLTKSLICILQFV